MFLIYLQSKCFLNLGLERIPVRVIEGKVDRIYSNDRDEKISCGENLLKYVWSEEKLKKFKNWGGMYELKIYKSVVPLRVSDIRVFFRFNGVYNKLCLEAFSNLKKLIDGKIILKGVF